MFNPDGLVGEVLDRRYRLVEFLGEGSFGWVYQAEELVAGEAIGTCAVKLLRPKTSDQGRLVIREFAAASRLSHSGLLQYRGAFDVQQGECAGALCMAMELAEGTLSKRLGAGRRLELEEVLAVGRDLAEVLAWLHGQGAVHRDLKPDNVFRVRDRWTLGDLGLLRAVEGSLVKASAQRGTLLYMAPEVLDDLVGPSVDVWALGVLLQECLTGVLAYSASSDKAQMTAMMVREPTIASDLPSPFDAVVRGCLVKDPRSRWTAQQVLGALEGASPALVRTSVVSVPRLEVVPSAPRGLVALGRNGLGRERFQVEGGGPVLVSLPAGRFRMGSPAGEEGRDSDETQHEVVLSRGFLLGEVPVTQAEYAAVVGSAPSYFSGNPDHPVEQVSWFEAVSFCNALSRGLGLEEAYVVNGEQVTWKGLSCPGFRLPTEAEWEYACRAGTTGARYGGLGLVAWYDDNSGSKTHPVRQKQPNAWGLYDTLGNVFEWGWDWYASYPSGFVTDPVGPGSGSHRVYRGGSWYYGARCARAAYRLSWTPGDRSGLLGFRLARSLP